MENRTLGNIIASFRRNKNMTQQELANILNVSNKTVSKWECDESYPDITLIPTLAKIFEVTTDELLSGIITGKPQSVDTNNHYNYNYKVILINIFYAILFFIISLALILNLIISYIGERPELGFFIQIIMNLTAIISLFTINTIFNNRYLDTKSSNVDLSYLKSKRQKYNIYVIYDIALTTILTLPLFLTSLNLLNKHTIISFHHYFHYLLLAIPGFFFLYRFISYLMKLVYKQKSSKILLWIYLFLTLNYIVPILILNSIMNAESLSVPSLIFYQLIGTVFGALLLTVFAKLIKKYDSSISYKLIFGITLYLLVVLTIFSFFYRKT